MVLVHDLGLHEPGVPGSCVGDDWTDVVVADGVECRVFALDMRRQAAVLLEHLVAARADQALGCGAVQCS